METKKIICQNKKASHDYHILDSIEAGIVLVGTEIKSIRQRGASLNDAYCEFKDGEMFLKGLHIAPYDMGNLFNHDPDRLKKLLLKKREIVKLYTKRKLDGITIIPLKVYLSNGLCKVELGVAEGKNNYDRREDLKKKDNERYIEKVSKRKYD